MSSKSAVSSVVAKRSSLFAMFLAFFVLAALPSAMHAQSTFATVQGVVLDVTGAAVPSASIVVTNDDTGTKETVIADDTGEYRIFDLNAGTYSLVFSHAGFGDRTFAHQVVLARQVPRLDARLDAGAVATTVNVDAGQSTFSDVATVRTPSRVTTSIRLRSTSARLTTPHFCTSLPSLRGSRPIPAATSR